MVSMIDPYGSILGFLDQELLLFSSKQLLSYTYDSEWIPFQTHHFSDNLAEPGIEPRPLDL
jgi:hypothetical protein